MRVLFVFALCVLSVYGKVTPNNFPTCKRSDPEIEKCVLEAIENMLPQLKTGIPQLNIPSLDPFNVPTLKLDRTEQNLRIKATITEAKSYGGSNFKIEKLKLNLNNKYTAEMKVRIPSLSVSANYDARGSKLLAQDFEGKGKFIGNFTGITVMAKGIAKPFLKDGVQYLHANKIVIRVRINNAHIAFDESDNPQVANSAATFFNANPGMALEILNPLIDETTASVTKAYINKIFGGIPLNEVLVD